MRDAIRRRLTVGGKLTYSLGLSGLLLYCAVANFDLNREFWTAIVRLPSRTLWLLSLGALMLVSLIIAITGRLERVPSSMLGWRLFQTNINFIPMHYRWLRWPFLALLLFQLPTLAFTEEAIFRAGWLHYPTTNWFDGFWRSLGFGLAHILSGSPLRVCLALTLGGLWFTHVYLVSGLEMATAAHTLYNAFAFTYVLSRWRLTGKDPFRA